MPDDGHNRGLMIANIDDRKCFEQKSGLILPKPHKTMIYSKIGGQNRIGLILPTFPAEYQQVTYPRVELNPFSFKNIEPVYDAGGWNVVSYTIKKTDGTVLGSFPKDKWHCEVGVINDVVYAIHRDNNTDEYFYYTLPEFRKYIFHDANSVQPVPAMVRNVSGDTHDLMGRKVSEHQKGIVVKDGKKMIAK